jgi:hypothetical protein
MEDMLQSQIAENPSGLDGFASATTMLRALEQRRVSAVELL